MALSRADNSPNVIWEALSFDIPIISVNVGGIPEIANSGQIMLLNKPEDAIKAFADSEGAQIKEFIDSYNSIIGSQKMKNNDPYSIKSHIDLYLKVLSQDFKGENK